MFLLFNKSPNEISLSFYHYSGFFYHCTLPVHTRIQQYLHVLESYFLSTFIICVGWFQPISFAIT